MLVRKFLNPKNDIAFKRIFGTERNKDILLHFVNDILSGCKDQAKIKNLEFIPTISVPDIAVNRVSIVDIMCEDAEGKKIIIEMQVISDKEYLKRAQYYASRAYINQRTKDVHYKNLKEVIFIAICQKSILYNHEDYISYHQILELNTKERHLKDFSYTFIELDKFNKNTTQLKSMLDKWIYFFKHAEDGDSFPSNLKEEKYIHRALEELNSFNWTNEEIMAYEHLDAEIETYENVINTIKEQGIQQGIQQGIEQGIEQGKRETQRALVCKMLKAGLEITLIASLSNFSVTEIQKIQKTIK